PEPAQALVEDLQGFDGGGDRLQHGRRLAERGWREKRDGAARMFPMFAQTSMVLDAHAVVESATRVTFSSSIAQRGTQLHGCGTVFSTLHIGDGRKKRTHRRHTSTILHELLKGSHPGPR